MWSHTSGISHCTQLQTVSLQTHCQQSHSKLFPASLPPSLPPSIPSNPKTRRVRLETIQLLHNSKTQEIGYNLVDRMIHFYDFHHSYCTTIIERRGALGKHLFIMCHPTELTTGIWLAGKRSLSRVPIMWPAAWHSFSICLAPNMPM